VKYRTGCKQGSLCSVLEDLSMDDVWLLMVSGAVVDLYDRKKSNVIVTTSSLWLPMYQPTNPMATRGY